MARPAAAGYFTPPSPPALADPPNPSPSLPPESRRIQRGNGRGNLTIQKLPVRANTPKRHRHYREGTNPEVAMFPVRPEPVEGSPSPVIPRATSNPTPCAAMHPDTATLRPHGCLRYRLPMVVAISHRNHSITAPHTVVCAVLLVGRHGPQRWPEAAHQATGWRGCPFCKKRLDL